jgi:nucleoside-diphosphate-sugar epimerase
MRSSKIVVTGSSGFVGSHLVDHLLNFKYDFVATSRSHCNGNDRRFVKSPQLGPNADWSRILKGCETVVHLAARAHIAGPCNLRESEDIYGQTNEKGASRLVGQAIDAGVKRFIFISSIGVVADTSRSRLSTKSQCTPITCYARSKLAAEKSLKESCAAASMKYTIIRPPLVYGPKNPGNMAKLLKIIGTGIPMPLAALDLNLRSFVGIYNLIDLILLCLEHPAAANQTFHVSDDDDISTAELLRRMAKALGKPVRNLPVPRSLLRGGLRLVGKGEWVDKLFGDLRVDISETKRVLGWEPKVTMQEELQRTANWWGKAGKAEFSRGLDLS